MKSVAEVTNAANSIMESVAECPPKEDAGQGKDSACAKGIVDTFADFSGASEYLSKASVDCANTMGTKKGASCGLEISAAIKTLSVSSGFLIAATDSCKPPSDGGNAFGCVADVVDVVDSLANAAKDIEKSVHACGAVNTPVPQMSYLYNSWLKTGCTAIPSPDWIRWGEWYAQSSNATVLQDMFDWCASSKATGGVYDHVHAARLCCGKTGDCPTVNCVAQQQFTGSKQVIAPETRGEKDARDWPRSLE
jgi:hypothetical protein